MTGRSDPRGQRRALPWALAALAIAALAAAVGPAITRGVSPDSPVVPQPALGAADLDVTLMGAAGEQAGGETWGYRQLPLSIPPPRVNGSPLEFGPHQSADNADPQLAFLRWTRDSGWQYVQTPLDEAGNPYRGFVPNERSARVTPEGGALLVGRDTARAGNQVVVLGRDPGERFRALPPPPADVLPGDRSEVLATEDGTGRVAAAAYHRDGRTGAFFGILGGAFEGAVANFDGTGWTREPVEVPAGEQAGFQVLGIAAAGPGHAWLVARTDDAAGRGVLLFERTTGGGGPLWVERDLGSSTFADRTTPAAGIQDVQVLTGKAQPLTATADGVWVDGALRVAGVGGTHTFTLFFDSAQDEVTGSWCDVRDLAGNPICDQELGARLSPQLGYRSFAWGGDGYGERIVTNPLIPGSDGDSNRGSYLRLAAGRFQRMPGGGGNFRAGGAFSSPDEGWLPGPIHITREPEPQQISEQDAWPVAARAPLTSVAPEPGSPPGSAAAQALAVGLDGTVLRYKPGAGWDREFLLSSSGIVTRGTLRGVAWPEAARAHAVGDQGTMWMWRRETGLWERDPGAPIGFEGNLMDIAFDPGNPDRGYAVGKGGVLLAYGKGWTQDQLPAGFQSASLTQIAFAGHRAIVAAGTDLLVNDGSGWQVDDGARELLRSLDTRPNLFAVAGLPDGGAVAAGENVVIERDSAGSPWRFADQPLPGSTVVATAAYRDGGRVRAVVSVVPRQRYPQPDLLPDPDPNVPPPIPPPFPLPGDGYVLREVAQGWRDEQHTAYLGSGPDRPVKSDPILDFDLDASGHGWAVGGWSGEADSAGRGSSGRNQQGRADRLRAQTAGIYRYGGEQLAPPGSGGASIPVAAGQVRFAVAGHAQCETACADLLTQRLGPDQTLARTLSTVATMHAASGGPRALLYTGGRLGDSVTTEQAPAESRRYAELLSGSPSLPVFPAPSATDNRAGIGVFRDAFAGFASPFGSAPPPPGITPASGAGPAPGAGARTHYAFDSSGPGGAVRVIVIDNSAGSLEAADAHQNPAEPQRPWLAATLADARGRGIPAIVVGSRDLNSRFNPRLNVAADAAETVRTLIDGGASAYFFERPEENRMYRLSSGGATIPAFGTGTLGYRSPVSDPSSTERPDALFGDSGFLLAQVDVARRDPSSNRAPVSVRLIPSVADLSLQAVDGTLLRRSRPALFQGLGRRPIAGDRWGQVSPADGNANPPGSDPYVAFPPAPCIVAGCSTRVAPEYQFRSSDPDIGDFVRQDPNSTNLRKPVLGANGKPISDSQSGLFCAYNAGTTTVTVLSGGLAYAQRVRVLAGSVQRPCGTVPLRPDRFRRAAAGAVTPPPGATPQGGGEPPLDVNVPPPPAPAPAHHAAIKPPVFASLPPAPVANPYLPPVPLPPPPAAVRPSPPSGGLGRAYQYKREEEVAPEEMQAYARYEPDRGEFPAGYVLGAIVLAALAGATVFAGPRGRDRRVTAAVIDMRAYETRRENCPRSRR